MKLTIIEADQSHTMIDVSAVEWDEKSNVFTVSCVDGDYADIRLAHPLYVKNVINNLKTLDNAEAEGEIAWNGEDFDEDKNVDTDVEHKVNYAMITEQSTPKSEGPSDKKVDHSGLIKAIIILVVITALFLTDPDIKNDIAVIKYTLNPDSLEAGEPVPTLETDNDSNYIFKIIRREGRIQIAYNTTNHVMYTLTCNGFNTIIQTEIMLNPDGSPMVWDEEANAPVGCESFDSIEATMEETTTPRESS